MSKRSEHVKNWRKRTKKRMIAAMGGSCACCGYNKCDEALDFHHLDPSQKDFGFGAARGTPMAWSSMIVELRKCVMLCATCHREVHAGDRLVDADAPRFNEAFATYERDLRPKATEPCPVCGAAKSPHQVTCSRECSGKRVGTIDWEKFDLLEMKKTMTNMAIAEIIGCSDVAVHKRLKKITNR